MNTRAFLITYSGAVVLVSAFAVAAFPAKMNSEDNMALLDKKLETITRHTKDQIKSYLIVGNTMLSRKAFASATYTNDQGELCNTTITREFDMWGKKQVSDDQIATKCGLTEDPNYIRLSL